MNTQHQESSRGHKKLMTDARVGLATLGNIFSWRQGIEKPPLSNRRMALTSVPLRAMAVLAIVASATLVHTFATTDSASAVPASGVPSINVQPPMSGYFDRFGLAPPASHHIIFGGDFATDFYAPAGWDVRTRAWPASQVGAVQYRIASVSNTCAKPNYAGQTVKVEFYYNGVLAGWASYSHLNSVPVSGNTWVPHGQIIGYTAQWANSSCYRVSNPDGVHVHLEVFTRGDGHYACWTQPSRAWVDYWSVVARIGAATPTSKRSC